MKNSDQFASALAGYHENPDHSGIFDSPFWSMIIDEICESVRNTGTIDSLLKTDSFFIDFGICKELHPDPQSVLKFIEDTPIKNSPLPLLSFSRWLSDQISKIKQCDKRDLVVKELRINQIHASKLNREVNSSQNQRNEKILLLKHESTSPNVQSDCQSLLNDLQLFDEMLLESFRVKKAISKGTFFSVEQKRENAQRENRISKISEHFRTFLDSFQFNETITEIKQVSNSIAEILQKIAEVEQILEKNQKDLEAITKQQAELSPIELENGIRTEIEHIRDLTRLAAKRLHIENSPILIPEKEFFSYKKIIECLDRILEFDPKIFKNDRVALFGKPQVILIPGSGNALYDWKGNIILVPITYTGNNPITSISAAMIEYRLDTDEDKVILNSFSQLPETKTIRSSLQLKSQLTKDYAIWMTSEYSGYRVLPKNVKEWFEHEIGPNKNEIFIPPAYQPYYFSAAEFNKTVKSFDEKINLKGTENADSDDLWICSILYYIQGKYQQAYDLLAILTTRDIANPMIYYNLGQVASKLYFRSNAIKGFSEFINRLPQCWWTRVAGEHLRNIQSSGSGI